MTWTWTLTKFGIGLSLGFISSNPVGWAIGIPAATLIRMKNEENLNSSTLTLSDKEKVLRLVELATDYQWGAGLGIVSGAVISTATKEMANRTLDLGRKAGKEIAINNGIKTEVARNLITRGQIISNREIILKAIPSLHEIEELIRCGGNIINKLITNSNEEEFIENANALIESQNLLIDKIEENLIEKNNSFNPIKNNVLKFNKANVKIYIRNQLNKGEHRNINKEINKILKRIKKIQLKNEKEE